MKRVAMCVSLAILLAVPCASLAQNLTGTVLASDAGAPMSVGKAGAWQIMVRNSGSGTPSNPVTINVQAGNCH